MAHGPGPDDPFGNAPFGQYPGGQPPVPPPYGGPPVFSAPPQPPSGKANRFATLSLVFAFLFAPAGAVLGHLGLAQIQRTGERGRDRALIGTILSYVFTVAAVLGLVLWAVMPASKAPPAQSASSPTSTPVTSTTAAAAGPGPVLASQLPGFLLTLDQIKQIANAPNDYKVTDATTVSGAEGLTVTPAGCLTALFGGGSEIYLRSGLFATQARTLALVPPLKQIGIAGMEERVTQYRNASEASRQAEAIVAEWRRCAGPVTLVFADGTTPTSHYQVGQVTSAASNPSIMLLTSTMTDSSTFANTRVVAAKANVVVDLHMFGGSLGTGAEAVGAAILARIPG